jgi:transposase-like protein
MYSYEDRIRAVRLYIKLGRRTGATIRQLGYPTKNALKSWHREYEQGGDLRVGLAYINEAAGDLFHDLFDPQCARPIRHVRP